jgi:hypothetical protein
MLDADNSPAGVDAGSLAALAREHHGRVVSSYGLREAGGRLVKAYGLHAPGRDVTGGDLAPGLHLADSYLLSAPRAVPAADPQRQVEPWFASRR